MEIPKKAMSLFELWAEKNKLTEAQRAAALEKFEALFVKARYEPGEAIGIIAAQLISEPATQMSVDAKEKVILKHGDSIAIAQIGEFVDKTLNAIGTAADEGWEVADVSGMGIMVPSITSNEKIAWKRVLAVSRHSAPDTLIKITTSSGREIIATDSHSFVIRKDNAIVPVAGSTLVEGDRIPVLRYLPENCIEEIEVNAFANPKGMRRPLPEKLRLDEELGWLFGIFLSEGNCTPNYISVSNVDCNVVMQLNRFAEKHGFTVNEYDNTRGFAKGHDTRINSTHLSLLLKATCGTGSDRKKVPAFAYSAHEKFVAGLLRGYFDGDGNVTVERMAIRISSNSKELIDGVALLLARFGIFASKGKDAQWTLVIPHKYAKIFRERVGFSVKYKADQLDELCRISADGNKQDFLDMIGGFGTLLKDITQKLDYPTRYINNFTNRQKVGRSALIRYIALFENLSKEKGIDVRKELTVMKRMAYSDVVWDEIEEIVRVKPSSGYVYDLTIEDAETFTTFDGIVTHNTMRSYILATQRDRLSKVTQGLPRLIEIFDVRKTFEKNMKIYLKPEFNTKEDATAVASAIKSRKVADAIASDSIDIGNMRLELELERAKDREKILQLFEKTTVEVTGRENKVWINPKKGDVKNLRKIRSKLLKAQIDGLKGIEEVVVVKDGNDWMIQTAGTNLKKVLRLPEVDITRTTTNDLSQVYEVLGIEAARNAIFLEAKTTLDEQGLDIDVRHLLLLADTMTVDGEVKPIGRYGVSGEKKSVLARANFEETKKHIVNASFYGERDDFKGVVETIMIGGIIPMGTGMVKLGIDVSKMKAAQEK